MSFFIPSLVQPGLKVPPRDKVTIFGDGNTKGLFSQAPLWLHNHNSFFPWLTFIVNMAAVFVKESDVAAFTINALDDRRTSCKVLYLRPPGNVYSFHELIDLWEAKIGKKLEKSYVSEEELLKNIKGILVFHCLFKTCRINKIHTAQREILWFEGFIHIENYSYTRIEKWVDFLIVMRNSLLHCRDYFPRQF